MKLKGSHHFRVRETFNPITLISRITQLLFTQVCKFCCFRWGLHVFNKYTCYKSDRWWEKFLSTSNLIKHTYSWSDELIILGALNKQAKKFYVATTITCFCANSILFNGSQLLIDFMLALVPAASPIFSNNGPVCH